MVILCSSLLLFPSISSFHAVRHQQYLFCAPLCFFSPQSLPSTLLDINNTYSVLLSASFPLNLFLPRCQTSTILILCFSLLLFPSISSFHAVRHQQYLFCAPLCFFSPQSLPSTLLDINNTYSVLLSASFPLNLFLPRCQTSTILILCFSASFPLNLFLPRCQTSTILILCSSLLLFPSISSFHAVRHQQYLFCTPLCFFSPQSLPSTLLDINNTYSVLLSASFPLNLFLPRCQTSTMVILCSSLLLFPSISSFHTVRHQQYLFCTPLCFFSPQSLPSTLLDINNTYSVFLSASFPLNLFLPHCQTSTILILCSSLLLFPSISSVHAVRHQQYLFCTPLCFFSPQSLPSMLLDINNTYSVLLSASFPLNLFLPRCQTSTILILCSSQLLFPSISSFHAVRHQQYLFCTPLCFFSPQSLPSTLLDINNTYSVLLSASFPLNLFLPHCQTSTILILCSSLLLFPSISSVHAARHQQYLFFAPLCFFSPQSLPSTLLDINNTYSVLLSASFPLNLFLPCCQTSTILILYSSLLLFPSTSSFHAARHQQYLFCAPLSFFSPQSLPSTLLDINNTYSVLLSASFPLNLFLPRCQTSTILILCSQLLFPSISSFHAVRHQQYLFCAPLSFFSPQSLPSTLLDINNTYSVLLSASFPLNLFLPRCQTSTILILCSSLLLFPSISSVHAVRHQQYLFCTPLCFFSPQSLPSMLLDINNTYSVLLSASFPLNLFLPCCQTSTILILYSSLLLFSSISSVHAVRHQQYLFCAPLCFFSPQSLPSTLLDINNGYSVLLSASFPLNLFLPHCQTSTILILYSSLLLFPSISSFHTVRHQQYLFCIPLCFFSTQSLPSTLLDINNTYSVLLSASFPLNLFRPRCQTSTILILYSSLLLFPSISSFHAVRHQQYLFCTPLCFFSPQSLPSTLLDINNTYSVLLSASFPLNLFLPRCQTSTILILYSSLLLFPSISSVHAVRHQQYLFCAPLCFFSPQSLPSTLLDINNTYSLLLSASFPLNLFRPRCQTSTILILCSSLLLFPSISSVHAVRHQQYLFCTPLCFFSPQSLPSMLLDINNTYSVLLSASFPLNLFLPRCQTSTILILCSSQLLFPSISSFHAVRHQQYLFCAPLCFFSPQSLPSTLLDINNTYSVLSASFPLNLFLPRCQTSTILILCSSQLLFPSISSFHAVRHQQYLFCAPLCFFSPQSLPSTLLDINNTYSLLLSASFPLNLFRPRCQTSTILILYSSLLLFPSISSFHAVRHQQYLFCAPLCFFSPQSLPSTLLDINNTYSVLSASFPLNLFLPRCQTSTILILCSSLLLFPSISSVHAVRHQQYLFCAPLCFFSPQSLPSTLLDINNTYSLLLSASFPLNLFRPRCQTSTILILYSSLLLFPSISSFHAVRHQQYLFCAPLCFFSPQFLPSTLLDINNTYSVLLSASFPLNLFRPRCQTSTILILCSSLLLFPSISSSTLLDINNTYSVLLSASL